ncbi:MAG: glycosyltransferase family 4 protein [Thermodesulfobacteriota bacterium]
MLYLGLIPGNYIGWGICSRYLVEETRKLTEVTLIEPGNLHGFQGRVLDGKVLHTIGDQHLTKVMEVTGKENCGYTFFENLLPEKARENACLFDLVLAGSTWCLERLEERGIHWVDTLIQGIDPRIFFPLEADKPAARDFFVIFSGGKFELRKGQDIVIRAVKVMQDRHRDVLFVNAWYNAWPFTMNTMASSPLIRFEPLERWTTEAVRGLLHENGVDLSRTEVLPRIPQDQFMKIYACTDVGLFPNRCEGGTNLVLMEYMACGKPVVASFNSGHRDILNDRNSLPVRSMTPFEFRDGRGELTALWEEPDLEEVIEKLEHAYGNRHRIRELGRQAGRDLQGRTWAHTARDLLGKMGIPASAQGTEARQ